MDIRFDNLNTKTTEITLENLFFVRWRGLRGCKETYESRASAERRVIKPHEKIQKRT